jgi:hypothetical protein
MSLPHQSLYGAVAWLRPHLPGANALKILGAFVGGIACTGAVVAWNGSQGSFLFGNDRHERPHVAAVAPEASPTPQPATAIPPASATNAQADVKHDESPAVGSSAAKSAETTSHAADASDAANAPAKARCENQTWPYIEQRCLTKTEADATAGSRSVRIRIVSTDKTVASDPTPGPSQTAEAQSVVAEQAQQSIVPEHVTAALPIPLPLPNPNRSDRDVIQPAAATPPAPPPAQPVKTDVTPASTPSANNTASAEPPPAPEVRSRTRSADKRRQRREERWAKRRHDGDDGRTGQRGFDARDERRGSDTRERGSDTRDDRMLPSRQNERDGQFGDSRQGRQVTVEQTYRLPDGRRVVVRRAYRGDGDRRVMPDRGFRDVETSDDRRPYARYQSRAPSRFVVADDDD